MGVFYIILGLLAVICASIMVYILTRMQNSLVDLEDKLNSTNLLLAVIANKQGATEEDLKEAIGGGHGK